MRSIGRPGRPPRTASAREPVPRHRARKAPGSSTSIVTLRVPPLARVAAPAHSRSSAARNSRPNANPLGATGGVGRVAPTSASARAIEDELNETASLEVAAKRGDVLLELLVCDAVLCC